MERFSTTMSAAERLKSLLEQTFSPNHLEIINESDQHHGRAGGETHFLVVMVSDSFKNMSRLRRQKWVYQVVDVEIKAGIHAFSQRLFTVEEWKKQSGITASPPCLGTKSKASD